MNYLNRALNSFLYHKMKTLFMIIMFSSIFSVIVSGLMLYTSSNSAINTMKKSVSNSITLNPITTYDRGNSFAGYSYGIKSKDMEQFRTSKYVEAYNYYDFAFINNINLKKYIGDEIKYEETKKRGNFAVNCDGTLYGLVDSTYDAAFTVNGYQLVKGKPIIAKNANQKVCLVSQEVANLNHLALGDTVQFSNIKLKVNYTLTIIGIFNPPEGEYLTGYGCSPSEIIFTPVTTMKLFLDESGYERLKPAYITACVYLKDSSYLDVFIQETQNKMNIQKVYDSHFGNDLMSVPKEFADWSASKITDYYEENHWYYLQIDREWYNMIASPIEDINNITGVLIAGIILGITLILVLICILSLKGRKKEFGVLLSVGESKIKILGQILIELFAPIFISALIGLMIGLSFGSVYIRNLSNDIYNSKAEELSKENQTILYDYSQEATNSTDYGWNHSGFSDLMFKYSNRIKVHPNIEPKINLTTILWYLMFTFGLIFIVLSIQITSILILKPVHVLTGRNK